MDALSFLGSSSQRTCARIRRTLSGGRCAEWARADDAETPSARLGSIDGWSDGPSTTGIGGRSELTRLLDVREPRVDVRALPLSVGEERSHWLQLLPLLRQTKTVAVVSKVGLCEQQSQTLSIDRSDTLSAEHMIRLEKKEKRLLAFSSFLTQVLKMTCTRALLCVL